MLIEHITIENFGALSFYHTELTQALNLIDSHYADEIAAAAGFLLCSRSSTAIPSRWLQADTRIFARVRLNDTAYSVCAKPQSGQLQLFVTDLTGADATTAYCYALSQSMEQNEVAAFHGQDKTTPLRLYRYWCREDDGLSVRTGCLADTHTFRRYLHQYIRAFRPEPINNKKQYQAVLSPQGRFCVRIPGVTGKPFLSETEEKLFRYTCFLNVAEFWAGFEKLRDLHHEKRPLLIQHFIEFLDESASVDHLIARTKKLQRQIIILTGPMDQEAKKKWMET